MLSYVVVLAVEEVCFELYIHIRYENTKIRLELIHAEFTLIYDCRHVNITQHRRLWSGIFHLWRCKNMARLWATCGLRELLLSGRPHVRVPLLTQYGGSRRCRPISAAHLGRKFLLKFLLTYKIEPTHWTRDERGRRKLSELYMNQTLI